MCELYRKFLSWVERQCGIRLANSYLKQGDVSVIREMIAKGYTVECKLQNGCKAYLNKQTEDALYGYYRRPIYTYNASWNNQGECTIVDDGVNLRVRTFKTLALKRVVNYRPS